MNIFFSPSDSDLPSAIAGISYNQLIDIAGGNPPYEILFQGRIPGITPHIMDESVFLTGVPTKIGIFTFTITVLDFDNIIKSQSYNLRITLQKFANHLEKIRQNAIYLNNIYSSHEFQILYENLINTESYYSYIYDQKVVRLLKSIIYGLIDLLYNPYLPTRNLLEIIITTLPNTIRYIEHLI
jgi:hypothetical protein